MPLTFKPETHQYFLDGVELPSVTRILADEGFINTDWYKESDAAYGRAVHQMVSLDLTGQLDSERLDEGLQNPYQGWKKFRKENPKFCYVKDTSEKMIHSHPMGYAGTIDFVMKESNRYHLFDIKTSETPQQWWRLQTEAYNRILGYRHRIILMLTHKAPTYNLVYHKDPSDFCCWQSVLTTWKWKEKDGLHKRSV